MTFGLPRVFRQNACCLCFVFILALLGTLAAQASPRRAARFVGVIAVPGAPKLFATIEPEQWCAALAQSDLVRQGGLAVAKLDSAAALAEALTNHASDYFAIINPGGEAFPATGPNDGSAMLARIVAYVRQGGIWWETGGWPLCHPFSAKAGGGWDVGGLGGESGEAFRLEGKDWRDNAPTVTATVTNSGREWLGADLARQFSADLTGQVGRAQVAVQRGSTPQSASVVLVQAGALPYLSGHRAGYGWMFRVGGMNPDPALIVPAAANVCEHLRVMMAEVANPAPGSPARRSRPPYAIGVIAPEPANGVPFAVSPDDLCDALRETSLVRCAYLAVIPLHTPEALNQALTERADRYLAIINPLGESFPTGSEADAKPMLDRIKSYVEQGGVWWEVGGVPFCYPCWPQITDGKVTGWGRGSYGAGGLALFDGKCGIFPDVEPPPVVVTKLGREMLGTACADMIARERGDANRPPETNAGRLVLAEVDGRPYVSASHVGKGLLWQVGGMPASPVVVFGSIMGTCRYLWTHPIP